MYSRFRRRRTTRYQRGQKQRWLPGRAALDKIGASALTEPTHGLDSIALETSARRDGNTWVLRAVWQAEITLTDLRVPDPSHTGVGTDPGKGDDA